MSNQPISGPAFVAIDFETANECKDSACAVGVAVVENGVVTQSFQRLIRPPTNYFSDWNFRTHGIHWQDVKQEASFDTVWNEVHRIIGGVPHIVAHNAGFDQQVLAACCEFYGIEPPASEFICTIEAASALWPLDSYTLPRVCEFLQIPLAHHNAESDAAASAHILLRAVAHGYDITEPASDSVSTWVAKHLSEEIIELVSSLMEDGAIEQSEIRSASRWLSENRDAASVWPGVELKRRLDDILHDGVISDDELAGFRELCCALLGLRERKKTRRVGRKKPGVHAVCFTGFGPRKAELRRAAEAAGYHVSSSITKSLNYLVCGPSPGPSKIQQATERDVKILSLDEWHAEVARRGAS